MSLSVSIKKSFKDFKLDIDFSAENEAVGFLGSSGCGKSLTMRCIAGIETPDEGKIIVNGQTFFDSEKKINLSAQERKTALLFQNYMLFPNLTVMQNVAAGIGKEISENGTTQKISKVKRDERALTELKRFGLSGFGERYPAQLSGGQQQRVALARMLAASPGILMLDEPFSALDSHLKNVLEQNLANLFGAFKGTILYVSHDIDEALRFCDRIMVVDEGRIVEDGMGDDLVTHPQTLAGMKLTGCGNVTKAQYVDDHYFLLPQWGIELFTSSPVPRDLKYFGIRAPYLEQVKKPGKNIYKVLVERVSDTRFERVALLRFLDQVDRDVERSAMLEDDACYLDQQVYWRVGKTQQDQADLPQKGQELLIRFPEDRFFLTVE